MDNISIAEMPAETAALLHEAQELYRKEMHDADLFVPFIPYQIGDRWTVAVAELNTDIPLVMRGTGKTMKEALQTAIALYTVERRKIDWEAKHGGTR